ncbi:hypothetical protein LOK74_04775 [Brevibacillus humidisoli]|uniref:hypothetical protein n=1 Tax=Brevibacillus humidisoli TaxID=2895522 RepID=UPI001E422348|nr:hypothetical protein [Brevibacillus humidisoli]UFJ41822.1 hypothetical protein LOK74_04775 [Brevibacillus humidisoli]
MMLLIYGFVAYFLISILRFMREKSRNDRERNQILPQLLKRMEKLEKSAQRINQGDEKNRPE